MLNTPHGACATHAGLYFVGDEQHAMILGGFADARPEIIRRNDRAGFTLDGPDEALARGIEWKCRYLLCAPCCQHELHKSLKTDGAMRALQRHGILRERLADLLTDTFRAQLLRILGFRVQVMEFVSADATVRNIMLKAEYAIKPGQHAAVSEYLELRDLWQVTPWLQTRLSALLDKYLTRY